MFRCKEGCQKLVVMPDGRIIPCEAFEGLVDDYPQFVLGNIHEGTTLEEALRSAKDIPLLSCFHGGVMDTTTLALTSIISLLHEALTVIATHEEEHPVHPWMESIRQHLQQLHKHTVLCSLENEDVRKELPLGTTERLLREGSARKE